jgi:hypothetical protein
MALTYVILTQQDTDTTDQTAPFTFGRRNLSTRLDGAAAGSVTVQTVSGKRQGFLIGLSHTLSLFEAICRRAPSS